MVSVSGCEFRQSHSDVVVVLKVDSLDCVKCHVGEDDEIFTQTVHAVHCMHQRAVA